MYALSNEYEEFLSFCKKIGKTAWPLVIEKYMQGDELTMNAISDLTLDDYGSLMDSVVTQGNDRARREGMIPTQKANWNIYLTRITDKLKASDMKNTDDESKIYKFTDNDNVPNSYILIQNFPNPFNMSTTLKFGLPKETFITLKVYNILGQEIIVLINKEFRSAGWYSVQWNGLDKYGCAVRSGIYIYKLITEDKIMSKKLIVVK